MSNRDDEYYLELDKRYNGSKYDYDERLIVKHWRDKKHCVKVKINLIEAIYIDPIT